MVPVFLSATIMVLTGLLWWNFKEHRDNEIFMFTQNRTRQISDVIGRDFRRRIQALQWFASTWEQRGAMSRDEFDTIMSTMLLEYPGFQAIQWVNSDFRIKWLIPLAGNERVLNMNVAIDENRRIALYRAKHIKTPTMSRVIDLVQGGKGFIVYFPIHVRGEFQGFLTAVFQVDRWMDYILQGEINDLEQGNLSLIVHIDGEKVYATSGATQSQPIFVGNNVFISLDHKFVVRYAPDPAVITYLHNHLQEIVLVIGIVMALLLGFVAHIALKNYQERRDIADEKMALQLEVAEQEITQQTFRHQSDMQGILMNIATNYINVSTHELQPSIYKALGEMAMFVGADRAYVFKYDMVKDTASNTHEWCQFGVPSRKANLQNIPLYQIQDWLTIHERGLPVQIELTRDLPEGGLRNILEPVGIKSLLAVPMLYNRELLGFVGFDWMSSRHSITEAELGLLKLFSEILVNIHQRTKVDSQVQETRRRMELALKGTNSGLWDWHIPSGKVVFNDRWAEIVGYRLSELAPTTVETWQNLAHPDDLVESGKRLEAHFKGETDFYECEARMQHKSGDWVWVLDRGKVVEWDDQRNPVRMTGTHLDITELKRAQEQLQHLANHDDLTGLPTRRLALDRGQMAIQRSMRNGNMTAFLFVDLDGFKPINDSYGHEVGDLVLKEVANLLLSAVRKSDTVARIGGDEFLIIVDGCRHEEEVERVAEVVVSTLSQPMNIQNAALIHIGCSIGIAMYPNDGTEFERLIQRADVAMYVVKDSGKNHFRFAGSVPTSPSA